MTDDDGRVEIPLVMFDGNMDILLNKGGVPCDHISLMRDPLRPQAVILLIGGTDENRAVWNEIGFKTGKVG